MAVQKPNSRLDVLDQMFNDVLVQTGKVLRTAIRDGKGASPQVHTAASAKIPASIDTFNRALDDLECQILNAKSVIERDLRQLREKRKAPQLEARTGVPAAPMAIDLEPPPKQTAAPPPVSAPAQPFAGFTGPSRSAKPEQKPVAPFPNMGFDLTVPPAAAPTPSPKLTVKAKEMKNSPRPGTIANTNGRPASAPPKKEAKAPPAQTSSRSAASTPQAHPAHLQGRPGALVPNPAPATASANFPAPPPGSVTAPAQAPGPAQDPGSMFTNMTFTLAPAPGERPGSSNQAQQQQQAPPPEIDLVALGTGESLGFAANNFGNKGVNGNTSGVPTATMMTNGNRNSGQVAARTANVAGAGGGGESVSGANAAGTKAGPAPAPALAADTSSKNDMFDLDSGAPDNMDMNYDLGDDVDNSAFNDLYFNGPDENTTSNDYNDAYFSF